MTSEGWIVMTPLVHSPGWLTSCVTVGSGDFVKLRRHQGQAPDSRRFCLEEKRQRGCEGAAGSGPRATLSFGRGLRS